MLVVCSMALASTACARSTQAASSPAKGSTVKAARSAQPKTVHVPAHLAKRTDAELATLGDQLLDKNLLDSALLCFEVVNAREADGDRVLYAHTLHHAGLIYYRQGIYGKAMERYMSSLQICEEDNLERELSTLYKNIGNVYSMFHDFDQSSALYKKSLALARKFKDYALENMALNNLIFAYTDKTPLSQYRRWQQEMLVHPEKRVRYDYDVFMTEAQGPHLRASAPQGHCRASQGRRLLPEAPSSAHQPCFFLWHDVGHLSSARPARLGPIL